MNPLDRTRLEEALQLAESAIGLSDPNPRVGCIIGAADGRILGRGYTQQAGGPHAEVMALRDAQRCGNDVRGATAWVTLEPCAHHGRTPPCCDALIAAGLARVVCAVSDPNPLVAGQGIARMQAAGINVELAPTDIAHRARELNIGFFSRIERGRPWIRMKLAGSLDGRAALPNGRSQWITGEAARADGHQWRRRAGAILTGIGTVLADDPRMDVRHGSVFRQPLCAVVDTHARLPAQARLLDADRPVRLYVGLRNRGRLAEHPRLSIEHCPLAGQGIDLAHVIGDLHQQSINEIHVEAGPILSGALLRGGWVDELVVYVAPALLGPGRGLADLPALERLPDRPEFGYQSTAMVGTDLRVVLRRL